MIFIDVIFNINSYDAFTYSVPEEIATVPQAGQRVLAPFGNRILTGVIVDVKSDTNLSRIKEIIDILDEDPLITKEMLQLMSWMSEYYLSPPGQTIQAALPRGIERRSEVYATPEGGIDPDGVSLTDKQRFLYDIIARDPGMTIRYYREKFGVGAVNHFIRVLENKCLIKTQVKISGTKVGPVNRKVVRIIDEFPADVSGLRNQEKVLAILNNMKGRKYSIPDFLSQTGFSRSRIATLDKFGLVQVSNEEITRSTKFAYDEKQKKIVLNSSQKSALSKIKAAVIAEKFRVFLVHGVTGSGKTQIYLEAINNTLNKGKTAIVLIPEISLTPQTVGRFENFFPNQVAVFHSRMSLGERYDTWRKINAGDYPIVVGPRSALFMPLKNLGMIVVDEEHDNSFKQNGSKPRYHARDVAIYRASQNSCVVILGSATPSMESYYNAKAGKYELLELPERINNVSMPRVSVIDMRYGKGQKRESQIFSTQLLKKLNERIRNDEQTILLQNRRGYSSFIQCVSCGYIPQCPHCAIALTYHSYDKSLHCHYCGHSAPTGKNCEKCNSEQLKYQGSGTQKIESELKRFLPTAKILRMDQDTTTVKDAHDTYLQAFRAKKFDILLGTQMISKGLDIPNVTLVGVISAEIGLSLPDFRASERVFQLLTQVAGRAGRDQRPGEVIIQSYLEHHYSIQFARNHDFIGFYNAEIEHRNQLSYPPFSRIINLKVTGDNLNATIQASREVAAMLRRFSQGNFVVTGPAPCPLTILKNRYRWQILLKLNMKSDPSGKRTKLVLKKHLENNLKFKKGDTRVTIDVDPVEML
jgi:primosomal protein N' (replication factor Y) (superfamily II helicase)